MLQVGGKKMSKSLGNFYTVKDLLDENIPGEVIRFILLNTHYRKPLDWTKTRVDEAKKILNRWRNQTNDITPGEVDPSIIEALSDDLNSVAAISRLHKLSRDGDFSKLLASAQFIGLLMVVDEKKFSPTDNEDIIKSISNILLQSRKKAFLNNSFTEFDTLKQAVLEAGLEVQVSRDSLKVVSTENFDVAALKGIVDE
jgi:cysteinyl-tRNA synthetase